jgi:hypothetical protein
LAGYLDGFKMWKNFYSSGIEGIFRGDIAFSDAFGDKRKPYSTYAVRTRVGFGLCSDYSNLYEYVDNGFFSQTIPTYLNKNKKETLSEYFDRAYELFRFPVVLDALNNLKIPFVDVIPTLASDKTIKLIHKIPSKFENGWIYREIVSELLPNTPMATTKAIENKEDILRHPSFIKLYNEALDSKYIQSVLPQKLINDIKAIDKNLNQNQSSQSKQNQTNIKAKVAQRFPRIYGKYLLFSNKKKTIDFYVLAFRVVIIYKIWQLMNEDLNEINIAMDKKHTM